MLAIKRARIPLKRDLIYLGTADEEAGSAYGARFVADRHRDWFAGAEYALSELAGIEQHAGYRAPFGIIVISEKTGLPLKLTARSEPGHGSMPWPDTAPHRLVRALGRLLAADRPLRVLPEVAEFFRQMAHVLPPDDARGFDDITTSLRDPAFRARFLADRYRAATVRTTFAVNMLRGSEKLNVIPPEAVADIDCRMLAGDDPQEILRWVRGVVDDEAVEITTVREPKLPNLSPPDTELYKALADSLRTRARRARWWRPRSSWPSPTTGSSARSACTATAGARSWWTTRRRGASTATTSGSRSTTSAPACAPTPRCCWPWPRPDTRRGRCPPDDPPGHPARRPDDPRADPGPGRVRAPGSRVRRHARRDPA